LNGEIQQVREPLTKRTTDRKTDEVSKETADDGVPKMPLHRMPSLRLNPADLDRA
jgi:hypothetical protein